MVYVVCVAYVLAYLIKYQEMTATDALKLIESKRKIANFLCCCGIRPQWRGVKHFERKVRGSGGTKSGARVAPVSPAKLDKRTIHSYLLFYKWFETFL